MIISWTHMLILYLTIGVITGGSALSVIPHERFGLHPTDPATILSFLMITLGWPIFLGLVAYSTFTKPEPRFRALPYFPPGITHVTNLAQEMPENPQEPSEASDDGLE